MPLGGPLQDWVPGLRHLFPSFVEDSFGVGQKRVSTLAHSCWVILGH